MVKKRIYFALEDGTLTEHSRLIDAIEEVGKAKKWAKIFNSKDPDEIMLYFDDGE